MANDDERTGTPPGAPLGQGGEGQATESDPDERRFIMQRRRFLQAGIGVTVALTVTGLSALSVTGSLRPIAKITPEQEPPADGDLLVFADDQSKQVMPSDVAVGKEQTLAYPKNVKTGVVKSGTNDNLLLLARFQPDRLGPDTTPHAADGIVAYSGVCTHLCCTVTDWDAKNEWLLCPCHHSLFDPRSDGKVMGGPAPRPLPLLPLRLSGGQLTVAGGFLTSVGCS